jgi:putative intracellular protease/amidase
MRRLLVGLGLALVLALVITPFVLAPKPMAATARAAAAIDSAEQAQLIHAMRPPDGARPVIVIITRNDGTEVGDFMLTSGILRRSGIADVSIVAERAEPVKLYPSDLQVEPELTMREFDERHPAGADYVVVPAMDPGTDPVVAEWIATQHRQGARIVSVCNGSRMVATAGLLDGRRATGHWSAKDDLEKAHPTMQWVSDRRYVSDDGVTTSTGISASLPTMLALVEAIGGRDVAERVARDVGLPSGAWDARHRSATFDLTNEHRKTFVRNTLTLWRHERVGVPLVRGVDEIALGMTIDAYSRTKLADVVTVSPLGDTIRTRHGLLLRPDASVETADVDEMLPVPSNEAPATTLDRLLPLIAARYDSHTAAIVTLVMEYPWVAGR